MRITGRDILKRFAQRFPDAEKSLAAWSENMSMRDIGNFAELRKIFGSADVVGHLIVFDIRGNRYRLIAQIDFCSQRCNVCDVLTHTAYERRKWMKHAKLKDAASAPWPDQHSEAEISHITCSADLAFARSVLTYIGNQGATQPEHPQNQLFGELFDVIYAYEQVHCPFP